MRNYITTHRVDDSWSALYAAQEQKFISIGNGKDGSCKEEAIFKMTNVEDNLLKHYMEVRNRGLLLNKGNVDAQGRPTISDPKPFVGSLKLLECWELSNKIISSLY